MKILEKKKQMKGDKVSGGMVATAITVTSKVAPSVTEVAPTPPSSSTELSEKRREEMLEKNVKELSEHRLVFLFGILSINS